jgi:hypothetical protein
MKTVPAIRVLAMSLLCVTAVAACSGGPSESSVQTAASADDRQFGLQKGESLYELTPAERRLEWVRRPSKAQTAAVDARVAGESSSPGRAR